jgi:hypothetical protein
MRHVLYRKCLAHFLTLFKECRIIVIGGILQPPQRCVSEQAISESITFLDSGVRRTFIRAVQPAMTVL